MIGNGYPLADDEERSPSRGRSVTIVFPRATGVRRGLVLAAGLIVAFGVVAAVLAAGTGYDFQEASGTLQAAPLRPPSGSSRLAFWPRTSSSPRAWRSSLRPERTSSSTRRKTGSTS